MSNMFALIGSVPGSYFTVQGHAPGCFAAVQDSSGWSDDNNTSTAWPHLRTATSLIRPNHVLSDGWTVVFCPI